MNGAVALPLDLAELSFTASGDSLVRRSVLPSGVRILSEHVPGARSATIGYWVAVGSRDEQPGTYGSTHFLEHLLFKGTTTRTALDIAVSLRRGRRRAQRDDREGVHLLLRQGADRTFRWPSTCSPTCSCRACSTRSSSRTSAASSSKNSRWPTTTRPTSRASASSRRCSGSIHSAVRSAAAQRRSRRCTRDAVWEHYRANYRAQDLVITVAGAVDHDVLVAGVTAALERGGWDLDSPGMPGAATGCRPPT